MISIEKIEELLKNNEKVSDFAIKQSISEGKQLYYVMGKLETSRAVDTSEISVTVYHDFDEFRGSSSFAITANDDEQTVEKKIADCLEKAAQVRNPYFPLAEKKENIEIRKQLKEPVIDSLKKVADDIFAGEHDPNASLNATEIFGNISHVRFLNSRGVDHKYDQTSLFVETIPSFCGEHDEFELYYSEDDGDLNAPLKANIEEALRNVVYRSQAKTLKEVELPEDIDIHIKGDMLGLLMENFAGELSYQSQYYQANHYSIGDEISPKGFDLTMKGELEGALASSPVDSQGVLLKETKIIENGKARALWGDIRFGTYMKQENITGQYEVIELDNYEPADEEEMKRPHLTIMNFSSPQLDETSGYFGGEVRLALYENNGEIIPLTGFAISGNIYEAIKEASFSREKAFVNDHPSFYGPKYMILKHMTVH